MKKTWMTKKEVWLMALLLLLSIALFAILEMSKKQGAIVEVWVKGSQVAHYPLHEDKRVELRYGGRNLLRIAGGYASVVEADCPDKLCAKQHAISKRGETIVCLPHKLVIKIKGGKAPEMDGVL